MEHRYGCVIDAEGTYQTFVLTFTTQTENGEEREVIHDYTLKEGERLIYENPPPIRSHAGENGFVKPCWTGLDWEEQAAEQEISAWEQENPAPGISYDVSTEKQLTEIQTALAEIYEDMERKNTNIGLALTEVYESLLQTQTETEGGI